MDAINSGCFQKMEALQGRYGRAAGTHFPTFVAASAALALLGTFALTIGLYEKIEHFLPSPVQHLLSPLQEGLKYYGGNPALVGVAALGTTLLLGKGLLIAPLCFGKGSESFRENHKSLMRSLAQHIYKTNGKIEGAQGLKRGLLHLHYVYLLPLTLVTHITTFALALILTGLNLLTLKQHKGIRHLAIKTSKNLAKYYAIYVLFLVDVNPKF